MTSYMSSSDTTCPKCEHIRLLNETEEPERCPACGLYFAKWVAREQFVPLSSFTSESEEEKEEEDGWRAALRERLQHIPENIGTTRIYASAILLIALVVDLRRKLTHGSCVAYGVCWPQSLARPKA